MDTLTTSIKIEGISSIITVPGFMSLKIKKSIHSPIEDGEIILPISARLKQNGILATSSIMTSKKFFEGDKITIEAGYNGTVKNEFKGFISSVGFSDPCKIKLEGYSYQLRKCKPKKSWEGYNINLRDILNELIKGTEISIHPDTPTGFTIYTYRLGLRGWNGLRELEELVNKYGLVAYFIDGNQLYVGLDAIAQRDKSVVHSIGWNTFDEDLEYTNKIEAEARIEVKYSDTKGITRHVTSGKEGVKTVEYKLGTLSSEDEAIAIGLRKLNKRNYEGYVGKISTRLKPYCQHGYKTIIKDEMYPEREGNYLCEGIDFIIDDNGDTRIVYIGRKLSK